MLFGDNESVVNTATVPHARLTKRHVALSYHRVREAVAAGILRFHHVRGKMNPADILSKHWDYSTIWPVLKPFLFWQGDTKDLTLPLQEEGSKVKQGTADNAKEEQDSAG
jgi:hypothetical protein